MSKAPYRGQCLCGVIKYEADSVDQKMGHCHCTMCQKFHGAAFSSYASTPRHNFRWLSGESELSVFKAENGTKRKFCQHCGSSLIFESAVDNGLTEFALASLDTCLSLTPDAHIYTGTKVDWIEINDELPKHLNGRS